MNIKIVSIICFTLILIGFLFWPTIYRYDTMTINGNVLPIRTNRLNGFTEYYTPGGWISQHNQKKSKTIPGKEQNKITIEKSLLAKADKYGLKIEPFTEESLKNFNAEIYNGSDWTITDIVIRFKISEDKSIKLIGSKRIPPLSKGDIFIEIPEKFSKWEIDEIRGYKD